MTRLDQDPGRFALTCAGYTIECTPGGLPLTYDRLRFAAWSTDGQKLWTTFVEPPWQYAIHGDTVELDVMGRKQSFGLREGPSDRL